MLTSKRKILSQGRKFLKNSSHKITDLSCHLELIKSVILNNYLLNFEHKHVDLQNKLKNEISPKLITINYCQSFSFWNFFKEETKKKENIEYKESILTSFFKIPTNELLKKFEELTKTNSSDISFLKLSAAYNFQHNQYDKSTRILEKIHQVQPDDIEALWLSSAIYQREGQQAKALEQLNKAFSFDKSNFLFIVSLVKMAEGYKNYRLFYKKWKAGEERCHPMDLWSYGFSFDTEVPKPSGDSIEEMNSVLPLSDETLVIPYLLILNLVENLHFKEIIRILREKNDPFLYQEFCRIYFQLEKYDSYKILIQEATESFNRALNKEMQRKYLDVISFHIYMFAQEPMQGFLDKAFKTLIEDTKSRDIELYIQIAKLFNKVKNYSKSIDLLHAAIYIDPYYLKVFEELNIAMLSERYHLQGFPIPITLGYNKASRNLEEIEIEDKSISMLFNIADVYIKAGKTTKFIQTIKKIIEIDKNCMEAYEQLLKIEKNPENRLIIVKSITGMDPKGYTRLGDYLYFDLRDFEQAIEVYKMRVEINRNHLRSRFMIWNCLKALKRENEAQIYYKELCAVFPKELKAAPKIIEDNQYYKYERQHYPEKQQILDAYGE